MNVSRVDWKSVKQMATKVAKNVFSLPWKDFAKEGLKKAAITLKFLCALHVTSNYVCSVLILSGPSMLPTLDHGDYMLVERLSTRFGKIKNGDVIIGISPDNPRKTICKRVVGLEGDTVEHLSSDHQTHSVVVPKGHVWLQGDNTQNSNDSRNYGPVPYALLNGKVFYKMNPFSNK